MAERVSLSKEKALERQVRFGVAECLRCGSTLRLTPVPPRPDLSYVRSRAVVACGECGFKTAADRK